MNQKSIFSKYESWDENPMNAVIGLSELMFDTQLDEKQYDIILSK